MILAIINIERNPLDLRHIKKKTSNNKSIVENNLNLK